MAAVAVIAYRPKINSNFVNPKYHTNCTYYIAGDMVGQHNIINLWKSEENNVVLTHRFSPRLHKAKYIQTKKCTHGHHV